MCRERGVLWRPAPDLDVAQVGRGIGAARAHGHMAVHGAVRAGERHKAGQVR